MIIKNTDLYNICHPYIYIYSNFTEGLQNTSLTRFIN